MPPHRRTGAPRRRTERGGVMGYSVAVLGATGLVGEKLLDLLARRSFPADRVVALASRRSAGTKVPFRDGQLTVREATPEAFADIDLVLSSAGGSVSEQLLPAAVERGAVAIDNTSAYRMEPDVPLVVPEVNAERIADYRRRGIIANPNCSTIQLVMVLKPLHDAVGLRRVVVSTYQSVSGAGAGAVAELIAESRSHLDGERYERRVFPHPIAFNALPHIDDFLDGGDTKEEWKMQQETPKILGEELPLHATCVRVPVLCGHSEAVWLECEEAIDPAAARRLLAAAPGVELLDEPGAESYPTAAETAGRDEVFVGRLRRDPTVDNGLALWVVADNLLKGAALNAVQIAEHLVELWQKEGRERPEPALAAT